MKNEGREIATVKSRLMKAQWREERRARRHSHGRPWVKFHKTIADVSDLYGGILVIHRPMQALGFFVPTAKAFNQKSKFSLMRTFGTLPARAAFPFPCSGLVLIGVWGTEFVMETLKYELYLHVIPPPMP